jgi:hypothetical protein
MSQNKKPEDDSMSSIVVDDFSSAVPGVTMLLNPKVILEREMALKAKEKKTAPVAEVAPEPTPESIPVATSNPVEPSDPGISITFEPSAALTTEPAAPPAQELPETDSPLARLGVLLELRFKEHENGFRFDSVHPHGSALEPWQEELYSKMRIELEVFGISVSYQEFSTKKNPFETDAFAAPEGGFVEFVRSRDHSDLLYVLISKRSLLMEKEPVYSALEKTGESDSGDGSGGIEIDFAS